MSEQALGSTKTDSAIAAQELTNSNAGQYFYSPASENNSFPNVVSDEETLALEKKLAELEAQIKAMEHQPTSLGDDSKKDEEKKAAQDKIFSLTKQKIETSRSHALAEGRSKITSDGREVSKSDSREHCLARAAEDIKSYDRLGLKSALIQSEVTVDGKVRRLLSAIALVPEKFNDRAITSLTNDELREVHDWYKKEAEKGNLLQEPEESITLKKDAKEALAKYQGNKIERQEQKMGESERSAEERPKTEKRGTEDPEEEVRENENTFEEVTKILLKRDKEQEKNELTKLERDNEEGLSAQNEPPQEKSATPKLRWVNFLKEREENPVWGSYPSRKTN